MAEEALSCLEQAIASDCKGGKVNPRSRGSFKGKQTTCWFCNNSGTA